MARFSQMILQDAWSPTMLSLVGLYEYVMVFLTVIMFFVGACMYCLLKAGYSSRLYLEAHTLELVWTVGPAVCLVAVAVPSLVALYELAECPNPMLTVKAIGHQWYWEYEYEDFNKESGDVASFNSYMLTPEDLVSGECRSLEVDHRVVLPYGVDLRVIVTAADVLHAWAVPKLGVKMDGVPGRLNEIHFSTPIPGVVYGMCSEICGANHTFMPISVEFVSWEDFISWVGNSD